MSDAKDFERDQISMTKEDAERWIKFAELVERLKQNPDFIALFDIYTRSEVLRRSYLIAGDLSEEAERNAIKDIKASGHFHNYINIFIPRMKSMAMNSLAAYEEENKG